RTSPVSSPAVRIAFLGPEGTFCEEALLSQPDLASQELVPIGDIVSVITAVAGREADFGVVPVENSIEGAVTATLDTLAFDYPYVRLRREITIPIDHHPLGAPATALS